ncbi:UvrD-helicase domain-containing protein [Citrobacter amalonaticus]|uniref:UvrD-helicase domain-containing protein n=1 Tax=Citrobacter amalonaticus TaxID=35703 RepID=UPI00076AEABC|nr:UvrD-helicase domain-containing protein [Citrobacter amalonaticus]AMG53840.1 ATP-dependent helicase [Citrobacter amalonaticus]MCX3393468.1 UvrD-helicase domain-containing protein [Citrobacter amalonaticus]MDQ2176624.1 UvrD-helicase domain-containing protein [Citrobacter amalonaticus]HCB1863494.1 ATP-dependent helicase [Citrobacter amalonaticus]HCB1890561.1 ATP-dependent helicase [Citrobacter amalonaticus]
MFKAQSPAEIASQRALEAMYACLNTGKSFRLEAGAGAGKTYSLIKALQFLIAHNNDAFQKQSQQIACITYTNVAKDEIAARIDRSPLVFCETNHAFCWSLISCFQKLLRTQIEAMPAWKEKIEEIGGTLGQRVIEYNLGHRSIRDHNVSIHHDDVLPLTISLMAHEKFRRIIANRFPIILVDEYQDTNNEWIEAIKTHLLGKPGAPLFGFFGDHWQKIYGGGCGKLEHPCLTEIGKEANFRSVKVIVDSLNRMRPALQQFVKDPDAEGEVRIFHTNSWQGERRKGGHWGGDLPASVGLTTLEHVKTMLAREGWDLSPCRTKILMLTHKLLANQQGYSNLAAIFKYNESFTKKENQHIAFFVDKLEPACDAFAAHKYGMMFEALGGFSPLLRSHADKASWHNAMTQLLAIRDTGTVGDIIEHLRTRKKPRLPDNVEKRERELRDFDKTAGVEMPRVLEELEKLHQIAYSEVKALRHYLDGHSPFETKHGVKGAEFENVLVVVGRGWNQYNFAEMLELAGTQVISAAKEDAYERNRNLFYVACSRPKKRLAILFTQSLSPDALATLESWFGKETIMPVP